MRGKNYVPMCLQLNTKYMSEVILNNVRVRVRVHAHVFTGN